MSEHQRSYKELSELRTFSERFQYLKIQGTVGVDTFGHDRYLNQIFYHDPDWRAFRRKIIIRDNGCDLGDPTRPILGEKIVIHHINPVTPDDIKNRRWEVLLNPDNAVCASDRTHKAIHYSDEKLLRQQDPIERKPNDTIPWKL